jgi:hypothetical protein
MLLQEDENHLSPDLPYSLGAGLIPSISYNLSTVNELQPANYGGMERL